MNVPAVIGIWNDATRMVTDALIEDLDGSTVYMMANSGAAVIFSKFASCRYAR
jgi:hypothetical protein